MRDFGREVHHLVRQLRSGEVDFALLGDAEQQEQVEEIIERVGTTRLQQILPYLQALQGPDLDGALGFAFGAVDFGGKLLEAIAAAIAAETKGR